MEGLGCKGASRMVFSGRMGKPKGAGAGAGGGAPLASGLGEFVIGITTGRSHTQAPGCCIPPAFALCGELVVYHSAGTYGHGWLCRWMSCAVLGVAGYH